MHTETVQRDTKSGGSSSGAPSQDSSRADRGALRGMSFAEGEAALAPSNEAPVQRQAGGNAPGGATTQAPEAAPNAPAAGAPATQEGPAPAQDILTPRQVLDAWDINRTQGLSVEWMAALQGALGVPATGISSKELVRALAMLQSESGQTRFLGQLKGPVRQFLVEKFPALAAIPQKAEAQNLQGATASANGQAPEGEALRRLQIAPSYSAYVGTFKTLTFLGHPVVGHPEFLGRVANAQKYLAGKMPGKSDVEIGAAMGVTETSHFRTSGPNSDQMYHGLGFALDVNPPQNNWHFGNGARAAKMSDVMKHVGDLFGEKMVRNAGDMAKSAKEGTTDELFAKLEASNEALKSYRRFASDPAALAAHLASDKATPMAKSKGAAGWSTMIANDEQWLDRHMKGGAGDSGPAGFMDYKKELVIALRDAGGLRWGGADLGGDNGDLMHFDGGTMDLAKRIRGKVRTVRAEATAQPAPGAAPPA